MRFGLSADQYAFILEKVVVPLAEKGAKVWCYGSRARGDHHRFSDLDLMVESTQDLTPVLGEINELLENSSFPLKVDLVQLSQFAAAYRPNFEAEKTLFRIEGASRFA